MMKRALAILPILCIVVLHATAQDTAAEQAASGGEEVVAFGQRIPAPATLPDAQLLATLLSSQRYIVTPGDRYRLTLVLEQTARFDLTVQDDGVLEVPYVGTVETTGREYSDLRSSILESLRRIPADYMEFELVSPARFEVFVGGAVRLPGTMIVHAINRVQDAIRLAGGVDGHGSVRRIELVRADGSSQRIDLARFFEIGGDDFNPLLRPSDRVYVPVAETTVTIAGGVRYPGSYELLPAEGVTELIAWAGGLLPDADPDNIEISGYGESGSFGRRTVAFEAADRIPLRHQDAIIVRSTNRHTDPVVLSGAFYGRPQDGTSRDHDPEEAGGGDHPLLDRPVPAPGHGRPRRAHAVRRRGSRLHHPRRRRAGLLRCGRDLGGLPSGHPAAGQRPGGRADRPGDRLRHRGGRACPASTSCCAARRSRTW